MCLERYLSGIDHKQNHQSVKPSLAGVYSKETVEQEYSLSPTAHFYSFGGRTRSDWDFDISEGTFQTFLLHGAYSDPSGRFQSCTRQTAAPSRHLSKDSTSAMTYSPLLFRLRSLRRHFFFKDRTEGARCHLFGAHYFHQ